MDTNALIKLTLPEIARRYSTEEAARDLFELIRWPNGPVCPHCGNTDSDRIYKIVPNPDKKIRAGVYKCAECREEFTVTVGTVMESSKIPLTKWLFGFYMMCASKTQVSALQLQRQLGIGSYRTAWFMCHRIRYALEGGGDPLGGKGGTVEADETFIGGKRRGVGSGYVENKTPVVSTVERGGKVKSKAVGRVTGKEITKVLREQVAKNAHLNTDESTVYEKVGREFASHSTVNHHAEEYARIDSGTLVTTNTVEGFFGNSKRSIDGTHHHISRQHTNLYFAELDYKYNTRDQTDGERTVGAIREIEGKRVMYQDLVAD